MKSLVLAFPVFALLSTAAFAGDAATPSKSVSYGDLNLTSQQDVVKLHDRIIAAATEVCTTDAVKKSEIVNTACKRAAVSKAYSDVGYQVSQRLASVD